jgi:hypothetical protein
MDFGELPDPSALQEILYGVMLSRTGEPPATYESLVIVRLGPVHLHRPILRFGDPTYELL